VTSPLSRMSLASLEKRLHSSIAFLMIFACMLTLVMVERMLGSNEPPSLRIISSPIHVNERTQRPAWFSCKTMLIVAAGTRTQQAS
jgi:hypothetical protein